jgi:hypothetical protein
LSKILRWGSPSPDRDKVPSLPGWQAVCPLWPSHWASLNYRYEQQPWIRVHPLQSFLREESVRYLQANLPDANLTPEELMKFAELLHDDPILLALFADTTARSPNESRWVIAQDVVNSWSTAVLTELGRKTLVPVVEYRTALERLVDEMLANRVLYPDQTQLNAWLATDSSALHNLGLIAEAGHLCYLDSASAIPRFKFRHDRLLEHFISSAIIRALLVGPDDQSPVWDPYFAVFMGRALGRHHVAPVILDQVQAKSPVALIAAVPYLSRSDDPRYREEILSRARSWIDGGSSQHAAEWHYGLSLLQETLSDDVLRLTEGISGNPLVWQGRFRNGDVAAGALVLTRDFMPGIHASWLEALISQALNRHRAQMVTDVNRLLCSEARNDQWRAGLLSLAGYVGESVSGEAIYKCWKNSIDLKETVLPALWAVFRCRFDIPTSAIASMLDVVLDLQDDPTGKTSSVRYRVLQRLGWSSRHGFTDAALLSVMELSQNAAYKSILLMFLAEVRSPFTVEFVVRELARLAHDASQAGSFSPFATSWSDYWNRWRNQGENLDECRKVLYGLWSDRGNPDWLREYAMRIWSVTVDLPEQLREIAKQDPLYKSAVWHRVYGGDNTVDATDIALLHPQAIEYSARVWREDFVPLILERLEAHLASAPENMWTNEEFTLVHTLRDIPVETAERLLTRLWPKAQGRPLFIQLALYLSTPKTREMAAEALRNPPEKVFEHIDDTFGFMLSPVVDRLTIVQLESLLPFLSQMSDSSFWEMIEFCGRHAHLPWAQKHLQQELDRRKKTERPKGDKDLLSHITSTWMPSEEQLLAEFDWIANHPQHIEFQLERSAERFVEQGGSIETFCGDAKRWFETSTSNERLHLLAVTVQYWGKRTDLPYLESAYLASPQPAFSSIEDIRFTVMRRSLD